MIQTTNIKSNRQMMLCNESDLHKHVVAWIRRYRPELILTPGLGELQSTDETRMDAWAKGYTRGTCDLIIMNDHAFHRGMCIEFKTPKGTGVLSDDQKSFLEKMRANGYHILVSNDYDETIEEIRKYTDGLRCATVL